MGILDFVEEAAGALAADKALEAVDPNAGLLARGAAAIAGFKGVEAVKDHFTNAETPAAAADESEPDEETDLTN